MLLCCASQSPEKTRSCVVQEQTYDKKKGAVFYQMRLLVQQHQDFYFRTRVKRPSTMPQASCAMPDMIH